MRLRAYSSILIYILMFPISATVTAVPAFIRVRGMTWRRAGDRNLMAFYALLVGSVSCALRRLINIGGAESSDEENMTPCAVAPMSTTVAADALDSQNVCD